ncbi:Signal transduction histidine kinase [Clostridium sp. DSM 8431]|uniref:sensor histidine kinase n=1 Tax=Clostridium sp. DSM 8431 TaxID=1761781 RepID=UPI0008F1A4DC|nr:HAMP domain-containing sensor histidine kinase [Clostridium sp. DSM 8431]SFU38852.1 Signal transduction histidine kinase [Clostridium sp. DSM 8431]
MELNERLDNKEIESLSKTELIKIVHDLQRKQGLQEEFLLNISHDLRSPINVILSVLQCLKYETTSQSKRISDEKRDEYKDIVRRNSLKIVKLIDNLIDVSKLEKNYYSLNKYNIEVINLIESTVTSIKKYAEQKNINMIFDTNIEECICAVDPEAIDRIMMNLLSNAIKFSNENGNILVNVNVGDNDITISVKDDGVGIKKEDQKIIFNRFIQATQNEKNEFKGSGIGLDLVSYLCKAHGGKVELVSEYGKGSNFIVTIPRVLLNLDDNNFKLRGRSKVEQLEVEFSDIYL